MEQINECARRLWGVIGMWWQRRDVSDEDRWRQRIGEIGGDMRVSGEGEGGEDTQTRAAVAGVQYDNM